MRKASATMTALVWLVLVTVCSNMAISQEAGERMPIEGFPDASLTVFPVTGMVLGPVDEHREFYERLMGPPGRGFFDASAVLVLRLETRGYDRVAKAEAYFRFPADEAARENRGRAFGAFVESQSLETDYAVCTELVLHVGKEGFQEIYTVMVDADGSVVWEDSLRPGDPAFDLEPPRTPEECAALVASRLVPVMALDRLPPTKLSAEKERALEEMEAGQPPKQSEFAAMEQRLAVLRQAGDSAGVDVYPTRVGGDRSDPGSAPHLVELLNEAELCRASEAARSPLLKGAGWPNEQEVLWRYARATREYVRQHPPESDYALFADYWFAPGDKVWAVHFVVCDRSGEWVIVDLQNNHHPDFQRMDPKTMGDCDRLVSERLKNRLR